MAYQKATRGVVRRTHNYRMMRKLADAFEDWTFAVNIGRKGKLLAEAEAMALQEGSPEEVPASLPAHTHVSSLACVHASHPH